jgi:hypothetical protein
MNLAMLQEKIFILGSGQLSSNSKKCDPPSAKSLSASRARRSAGNGPEQRALKVLFCPIKAQYLIQFKAEPTKRKQR